MASFFTGRHPRKTGGADLCAGRLGRSGRCPAQSGHLTRFPSLEIGCEGGKNGGECDHGYSCAYQSNLSWRGESTPVAKQINPRLVFDRLFGGPGQNDGAEDRASGDRRRKSILDFVGDDARQLAQKSGCRGPPQARRILHGRTLDRTADRPSPAGDGSWR